MIMGRVFEQSYNVVLNISINIGRYLEFNLNNVSIDILGGEYIV